LGDSTAFFARAIFLSNESVRQTLAGKDGLGLSNYSSIAMIFSLHMFKKMIEAVYFPKPANRMSKVVKDLPANGLHSTIFVSIC
jgi:hypothetical protein